MTTRQWESVLNIQLADEFSQKYGLAAKPEVIYPGNLRMDVEVRIGPAVIAVEAEHGQSTAKRREAVEDADARLKQGLAQCAVAVCYPDDTTRESLPNAQLVWTVRDGKGAAAEWVEGDIRGLVSVIRLTPAQLGDPDATAAARSSSLDGAVIRLSEAQKEAFARALDLPRQTRKGRVVRNPWDAPAKRALLVVATAVMFHSRLDAHRNDLRPEVDNRTNAPFSGPWPPDLAQQCAAADDPVGAFNAAWDLILALDYKPIFETGRAALLSCPQDSAFTAALRDTAAAALAVSGNIASLRHDLLGPVFHTVLDTARYDGSFYTTTPAATLLAALAITETMCDWQDSEAIAKLRITDPACGTGTLLMAAAERIRDLAPQARDDGNLAAALIERVLTGYDVNLTATHMAATTLGLLSPATRFRNMKIGRAFLGVGQNRKAYLGSLEFLDQQPRLMPWPNATQAVSQVDSGEEMSQAEPADLVIMNPPFTRDSLRHDQFSPADEKRIKDREKDLFYNKPTYMAGNSGAFLFLAEYICKTDEGVIATVLPMIAATDVSGSQMRCYLASKFHVEFIVASHDPERIYFSENTTIGEMLLVCRRWNAAKGPKPPTRVINLALNPAAPANSLNVARAILNGTVETQGYGTVQEWPEHLIGAGDWGGVQFLSPYLCSSFLALRNNKLFQVVALGEISDVGPEGRRIRDAFIKSPMPSGESRVALWEHQTEVTQSMVALPDTNLATKPKKEHLASKYWQQRSKFLLPNRMRLNTVKALAVRLDTPVVGSSWSPCNLTAVEPEKERLEKAICTFLNSSIGVLVMLGNRSNRVPSYPRFSIDDLRKLLVPHFSAIGEEVVSTLAAAYDRYANSVMLPLPQMNNDPVRQALNSAVCAALGVEEETVAAIRRDLSREPSVTGQRYAGLSE